MKYGSAHLGGARATSEALIALGLIERRDAMRAASVRWLNQGMGVPTPLSVAVLKVCKDRLAAGMLHRAFRTSSGAIDW